MEEGLKTLPVRLGREKTLLFMTVFGILLDAFLTRAIDLVRCSGVVDFSYIFNSVGRVTLTMEMYSQILFYPRSNYWAWGTMSLLGLVPVLYTQAALLEIDSNMAAIGI